MRHSRAMGVCLRSDRRVRLRRVLLGGALIVLCACGNEPVQRVQVADVPPAAIDASTPRFAEGPIGTACKIHNRGQANTARCGCIQAAANLTLSQSQQQRSVRFFNEPELLQAVKLSDTPANERFWKEWAAFAETAENLCDGT